MSNPIKREYDKLSLAKDIAERENIVYQFQMTGFLDRNEVIKKITSLQLTDAELALATKANKKQVEVLTFIRLMTILLLRICSFK